MPDPYYEEFTEFTEDELTSWEDTLELGGFTLHRGELMLCVSFYPLTLREVRPHVFCNMHNPLKMPLTAGSCEMCAGFYEEFGTNDEKEIMKKHFPNVKRVDP